MKKLLLVLFFIISSVSYAQSAIVVQLTESETQQAKDLQNQKKEIEGKISQLNQQLREKYTFVTTPSIQSSEHIFIRPYIHLKEGWGPDFEFSTDYKFIVPKNYSYVPCSNTVFGTNNTIKDRPYIQPATQNKSYSYYPGYSKNEY